MLIVIVPYLWNPQAQVNMMKFYLAYQLEGDYFLSVQDAETLQGVVDLNVTAQQLDAGTQTITFTLAGQPYGPITYSGNSNLLGMSFPSSTLGAPPDVTTPVQSCRIPFTDGWGCADLKIAFGNQLLSYATGEGLERRAIEVDIAAASPLDNYPFDTYTAIGNIKV
jgi:hypothetical protein